jgi:DnaJ family protein C protein 27
MSTRSISPLIRPERVTEPRDHKPIVRVKLLTSGFVRRLFTAPLSVSLHCSDSMTGKSCLVKRFCEGRFVSRYIPTIGIDYGVRNVILPATDLRVSFWDLSGSPDYAEVRNEFYKDAHGMILTYDVTSRKSFAGLQSWLDEAAQFGADLSGMCVLVVANKADASSVARKVTSAEGEGWARERGLPFYETSASSGLGVDALFNDAFAGLLRCASKRSP